MAYRYAAIFFKISGLVTTFSLFHVSLRFGASSPTSQKKRKQFTPFVLSNVNGQAQTMNMLTLFYWAIDEAKVKARSSICLFSLLFDMLHIIERMYACLNRMSCDFDGQSMTILPTELTGKKKNARPNNESKRINGMEYPIELGYYENKSRPLN